MIEITNTYKLTPGLPISGSNFINVQYTGDCYFLCTYDEIEFESDIVNNIKKEIPEFAIIDFSEVRYLIYGKYDFKNDYREVKIKYVDLLKMAFDCQIIEKFSEIIYVKSSKLKEYFESGRIFYMNGIPCRYDSEKKCFHKYFITSYFTEEDFN